MSFEKTLLRPVVVSCCRRRKMCTKRLASQVVPTATKAALLSGSGRLMLYCFWSSWFSQRLLFSPCKPLCSCPGVTGTTLHPDVDFPFFPLSRGWLSFEDRKQSAASFCRLSHARCQRMLLCPAPNRSRSQAFEVGRGAGVAWTNSSIKLPFGFKHSIAAPCKRWVVCRVPATLLSCFL